MKTSDELKLIVYVPIKDAAKVRQAIHEAGAGQAGDYRDVSYSGKVINRFTPGSNSNPDIGEPNEPQIVEEERIEFLCPRNKLTEVIKVMKKVHPYEEVAYDVMERIDV